MPAQDPRLIAASDIETARLIRHAEGRRLALSSGRRGVWLQPDPAIGAPISDWAPPLLVVLNTFDVGSSLVFEVIDTPKPGEILCFIAHDDDLELRHIASDQYDAAAWLHRNRYSRALFHEVLPGGERRAILLPDSLVA